MRDVEAPTFSRQEARFSLTHWPHSTPKIIFLLFKVLISVRG
jgi:hypothetical protein